MTTPVKGEDRLEEITRIIFDAYQYPRDDDVINSVYAARQIAALPCKGCEEMGAQLLSNGVAYGEVYGQRELLATCLRRLTEACKRADADGELPHHIDGSMLDRADELLGIPIPPKTGDLFKDAAPAPSTKPDRESADEGALREALEEIRDYEQGRHQTHSEALTAVRDIALSALSKDTEASAGEQR